MSPGGSERSGVGYVGGSSFAGARRLRYLLQSGLKSGPGDRCGMCTTFCCSTRLRLHDGKSRTYRTEDGFTFRGWRIFPEPPRLVRTNVVRFHRRMKAMVTRADLSAVSVSTTGSRVSGVGVEEMKADAQNGREAEPEADLVEGEGLQFPIRQASRPEGHYPRTERLFVFGAVLLWYLARTEARKWTRTPERVFRAVQLWQTLSPYPTHRMPLLLFRLSG